MLLPPLKGIFQGQLRPTQELDSMNDVESAIYNTFTVIANNDNPKIVDFLQHLDVSSFKDIDYRSIKYPYESLLKLNLLQRLKGFRFQTRLIRYLKSNPEVLEKLGLTDIPDQTTFSRLNCKIFSDGTKEKINYAVEKINEISEKMGIVFDIELLDPKPQINKDVQQQMQHRRKHNKINEITQFMNRRLSPFLDLKIRTNGKYDQSSFLSLLIHMARTNDFAENGSHCLKHIQDNVPDADTLLFHLKSYIDLNQIQRMFTSVFDVLWEAARKNNLLDLRKPVDLAIDFTYWPFYGDRRKTPYVVGKKPENGTNYGFKFAVATIVTSRKRFTLYGFPIGPLKDNPASAVDELLTYARTKVKIKTVYVDRGFYSGKVLDVFRRHNVTYLMPAVKNVSVKKVLKATSPPCIIEDFFVRNRPTTLFVVENDEEKHAFATNIGLQEKDIPLLERLAKRYSKRWGIETAFRVQKHGFRGKTTSRNMKIRLFYFLFSILLYNLWIFADILLWKHLHGLIGDTHKITAGHFAVFLLDSWNDS